MSLDTVTILTCLSPNAKANKEFAVLPDGTVSKKSYSAGLHFQHEEKPVSNIIEFHSILESLSNEPDCFIIRGKAKKSVEKIVRRKMHGDNAAFDSEPHYWVMLDIDKVECPAFMDAANNPAEVASWAQKLLPEAFSNTSCIYKFSSSQNVPQKIGEKPSNKISVHLVFWCNRRVSEKEWKLFFKANPCPVDKALFSPVQPHYTANPSFSGMNDPLPERIGILKGDSDTVVIPVIQQAEAKESISVKKTPPTIVQEDADKALELMLASYPKEGGRDRYCGAWGGVLCRGGWVAEAAAEFILELADAAKDEESMKRHDTVLRIYDAIEHDRPAMGIPVLKTEFGVERLEEILKLLGTAKPDPVAAISKLSNVSSASEIEDIIAQLLPLSVAERELHMERIKTQTKMGKTVLNKILKSVQNTAQSKTSSDKSVVIMNRLLHEQYDNARTLLRTTDGNFWRFNSRYWEVLPEDLLKKQLLPLAEQIAEGTDRISAIVNAAINMLEGRVFREDDPLRYNSEPPMVINCWNGEVWFDEKAEVSFKPHCPESYLTHCLHADYDPMATATRFDKAMLEIFQKNKNPKEMFRHSMELIGYICQPWRKLAIIPLLYGAGRNGKTSITTITTFLLGTASIMACRIDSIEKSPFKIGALANKFMLVDDDVDAGTLIPDGFLKTISEEKLMTGEHKHCNSFQFKCRAVPVMLGNDYPSLKDLSYGMRERLMVFPFNRRFTKEERITGLFDSIWAEEASGILNHAIQGFQRLRKRGNFEEPEECVVAKNKWIARSNVLASYIEDICEKGSDKKQRLTEFYKHFQNYGSMTGINNLPTQQGVKKRLESLGHEFTIRDGYPVVLGLYAPNYAELAGRGRNA